MSEKILDERFWSKVEITNTCWNWKASLNWKGYGQFTLNGKVHRVHRLSYEDTKGKIPEGLVINHICRNRACVNPEHLEVISNEENIRKGLSGFVFGLKQRLKTHCPQGHEYSEENTYISKTREDARRCKICTRLSNSNGRLKIKELKNN